MAGRMWVKLSALLQAGGGNGSSGSSTVRSGESMQAKRPVGYFYPGFDVCAAVNQNHQGQVEEENTRAFHLFDA